MQNLLPWSLQSNCEEKNPATELIFKIILKFPIILQMLLVVKRRLASLSVHEKKIRIMTTETSLSSHTMQGVRLLQPRTLLHTRVKSESLPNSQMGVAS